MESENIKKKRMERFLLKSKRNSDNPEMNIELNKKLDSMKISEEDLRHSASVQYYGNLQIKNQVIIRNSNSNKKSIEKEEKKIEYREIYESNKQIEKAQEIQDNIRFIVISALTLIYYTRRKFIVT